MKDKFQELMERPYRIFFKEKNDLFYFYIPALGICAKAKTLEEAYQNFLKEKEHYFKEVIELEEEIIPPVSSHATEKKIPSNNNVLKYLLGRDLVIMALVFVCIGVIGISLDKTKDRLSHKLKRAFNAPPEKERVYIERIEKGTRKISPYVNAVWRVFQGPDLQKR